MAVRPVNLSELVRKDPPVVIHGNSNGYFPGRSLMLHNATMGCAQFLATLHGFLVFRDGMGSVWVQHKSAPQIIPPPDGGLVKIKGEKFPYYKWLGIMHREVRKRARRPLDPKLPFHAAVTRLYSEYYRSDSSLEVGTFVEKEKGSPPVPYTKLKALNPYIAHRTWISKYLGGLGFTQMMISAMTKGIWQRESRKALWSKIASLYTLERNVVQSRNMDKLGNTGQHDLVLGDFIQAELVRNHQDPSPRTFLLACGINVDNMRKNEPSKLEQSSPPIITCNNLQTIPTPPRPPRPPREDLVSHAYLSMPERFGGLGPQTSNVEALGYDPITSEAYQLKQQIISNFCHHKRDF